MILKELLEEEKDKEYAIDINGEVVIGKATTLLKVLMSKYLQQRIVQITDNLFNGTKVYIEVPMTAKEKKKYMQRLEQVSTKVPTNYYCPQELQYIFEMDDDEVKALFPNEDI